MLVDLRTFDADLTGKEAQNALDQAGITLNKNTIPDDPRSPFVTSGVRIGTPSVTTAGDEPAGDGRHRRADRGARCVIGTTRASWPGPRGRRGAVRQVPAVPRPEHPCPISPVTRRRLRGRVRHDGHDAIVGSRSTSVGWSARRPRIHTEPTPAIGGVAMFLGLGAAMGAAWQMDRSRPCSRQLRTVRGDPGRGRDLRRRPDRRPPPDLGSRQGDRHRGGGSDSRLVRGHDVLLPRAVLGRVLDRRRLGAPGHRDLAAADGQRREPHRRARRAGRRHRRHRLGHVLPLQPAAQRRRSAGIAEHRAPARRHHLGMCVGFLPHNFNPARIFMGDGGSLLLGL